MATSIGNLALILSANANPLDLELKRVIGTVGEFATKMAQAFARSAKSMDALVSKHARQEMDALATSGMRAAIATEKAFEMAGAKIETVFAKSSRLAAEARSHLNALKLPISGTMFAWPQFQTQALGAMRTVSDSILQQIAAAGVQVRVGGLGPKSFPRGNFDWNSKTLSLPEWTRMPHGIGRHPSVVASTLHELGHAYDLAMGPHSKSGEDQNFAKAYQRDVNMLRAAGNADPRGIYSSFLQPGMTGGIEAFAEAFAHLHGAVRTWVSPQKFAEDFAHTIAYVQNLMKSSGGLPPAGLAAQGMGNPKTGIFAPSNDARADLRRASMEGDFRKAGKIAAAHYVETAYEAQAELHLSKIERLSPRGKERARNILQAEDDTIKAHQEARRYNQKQDARGRMFGQISPYVGFIAAGYVVSKVAGEFRSAWGEAVNFEASLKRVELVSQSSAAGMERLTFQARQLALSGLGTHSDIAKGAAALAHSGLTGPEVEKSIKPVSQLALLAQQPMEQVAEASATIMRAMGEPAERMGHLSNMLAAAEFAGTAKVSDLMDSMKFAGPWARQAGMKTPGLLATLSVLSNAGIKGEMGGTTLRMMMARQAEIPEPARLALKRFGVEFKDAQGNFRGLVPVMEDLKRALSGLGEQQKAGIIGEIFSVRAATGVLAMLNDLEGVKKSLEDIKQRGSDPNMLDSLTGKFLETTQGKIQKMRAAWMDALMPGKFLGGVVGNIIETMGKVPKGESFGTLLATLGGGLLGARFGKGGAVVGSLLGGAAEAAGGGQVATGATIGAAIASFASPFGKLGMFAGPVGMAAGAGIGAAIGALVFAIGDLSKSIKDKEAKREQSIKQHTRALDQTSDFQTIAGVTARKEMIEKWPGLSTGDQEFKKHEMMIGGKWQDVSRLSKDELKKLRQQVPGQQTDAERVESLKGMGLYGRMVLAKDAFVEEWQHQMLLKRIDPHKAEREEGWAKEGEKKAAFDKMMKDSAEMQRQDRVMAGMKVQGRDRGLSGVDDPAERVRLRKEELERQKWWLVAGEVAARTAGPGLVNQAGDLLHAVAGLGNQRFKEPLPASFSDSLFEKTKKMLTDQDTLRDVYNKTQPMNERLEEEAVAARQAAHATTLLYQAHREGLPWLALESEKIKLSSENLKEWSKIEENERLAREAGGQPSVMEDIAKSKRLFEQRTQGQLQTEMQKENLKVWQETRLPMENYQESLRRLDSLFMAGGLDADTYARGVRKAGADMDQVNGSMSAWKAGPAMEAGSAAAISTANFSRYEQELSSARQSEEHLRLMVEKMERLQNVIDGFGGAAGFAAELAKAILSGEGVFNKGK